MKNSDLKNQYRHKMRALLKSHSRDDLNQRSQSISRSLSQEIEQHPEWKHIALFSALPTEPSLSKLPLRHPDRDWLYPLVGENSTLSFHLVSDAKTLTKGHFGILEPNPLIHPLILPETIDLILCPGIAFTKSGKRLGQGGGFYDRFLPHVRPDSMIAGVCFPFQIIPEIHSENHDQRMHTLFSEDQKVLC